MTVAREVIPETLPSQRELFSVPREVAYFNCAYMWPLLKSAVAAGLAGLARRRAPGAFMLRRPLPQSLRGPHFLGFEMKGPEPEAMARRLAIDHVFVSERGAWLRISPHLYNDESDIQRLIGSLERHSSEGNEG
jgi:hypothetical protein